MEENKKRCFVMMPFSDGKEYPEGHFKKVYEQIITPAVVEAGYVPYRVDEDKICDSIINKIFEGIQNCEMSICDLSGNNPNVLYELGLRQAYDKPVVLIKDEKTKRVFDISGINTVPYSSQRLYEDVLEAREKIKGAINATREGKVHSVVQIVKAETASISLDAMTQNDRMELLLRKAIAEISEIKDLQSEKKTTIDRITPRRNTQNERLEEEISFCDALVKRWESGEVKIGGREIDAMYAKILSIKDEAASSYSALELNWYYHKLSELYERIKSLADMQKCN